MSWVPWSELSEREKDIARNNPVLKFKTGEAQIINGIFRGFYLVNRSEREIETVWNRLVSEYSEIIDTGPIEFTTGE